MVQSKYYGQNPLKQVVHFPNCKIMVYPYTSKEYINKPSMLFDWKSTKGLKYVRVETNLNKAMWTFIIQVYSQQYYIRSL